MSLLLPPPPGGPQFEAGSKPHGNLATQDLDILIQQPLAFLTAGIFARVHQATAQTLTDAADNVIHYDTVDEDPYSGWSGSPNWRWAVPAGCSGWYHVRVGCSLATVPANTELRPEVTVNGINQFSLQDPVSPSAPMLVTGSAYVYLFGGVDYVQGTVHLTAGSNEPTSVTAGLQPMLELSWVSN
jgi:hypothetical protein